MQSFDIQGHRGARGLAPENTIPAFRRALKLGVTTLEMDTVVSADQQVVVSHDPWFSTEFCSRPDGSAVSVEEERNLLLYQMPYDEIKTYDCGERQHPKFLRQSTEPAVKPLLRDVLSFSESYTKEHGLTPVQYNVETKSWVGKDGLYHPDPETFVTLIWKVIQEFEVADRFILQSFDVRTLQEANRMKLPIRRALLIKPRFTSRLRHFLRGIEVLGFTPEVYSPHYKLVSRRVVAEAHSQNIEVIPWTVNEPGDMRRLQDLSVDGLITDYPDVALGTVKG